MSTTYKKYIQKINTKNNLSSGNSRNMQSPTTDLNAHMRLKMYAK